MSEHAPLSPSAAHRWMICPASHRAERGYPNESSKFADEGSAAHVVRARCLAEGVEPFDYLGDFVRGGRRLFDMTRERLEPLYEGLERLEFLVGDIRRLRAVEPRYCLVEERLYFEDRFLADVWGTVDFGAFVEEYCEIVVSDLKFGMGHEVYPEHNHQQLIYAALFYFSLTRAERRRVKRVRIIIDQPRIKHAGGEWVIDSADLERWVDTKLYPAVEEVRKGVERYVPGKEQCFWCKVKPSCEAYRDFNIRKLGIRFSNELEPGSPALPGLSSISPKQRSDLLEHKDMIIEFLKDLSKSALEDALKGDPVPGFKAVSGKRGARQWANEEKAQAKLVEHLGDDAFVTDILSPAAAEKLLPRRVWQGFDRLIMRGDPAPVLVSENDRRPAIKVIEFGDERN